MSSDDVAAPIEASSATPRGARLKRVIILPFFLVIVSGFALSWILYIDSSRDALRDAISAILRESSDRIAEEIYGRLGIASLAARSNAAFLGNVPRNDDESTYIRRAFVEQLRGEPMIAIMAVGMEDGEYLEAQRLSIDEIRVGGAGRSTGGALVFKPVLPDGTFGEPNLEAAGYDPRQRPWYRAAIAAGGPAWSAPYTLYSNAEPAVAATMPVYRDGRLSGVSSATITLGTLSGFLAMMKEAENGLMFVTDADGRLIAISTSERRGSDGKRAVAAEHPNHAVSTAARLAAESLKDKFAADPGRFSFVHEGRRYLGRAVPFSTGSTPSWTIVLAVAESSYSAKLRNADIKNFLLLIFYLGAALTIGWLIVDYITKPLRALAEGVDLLRPGQAIPAELSAFATRDNELGRLSRSFVAMKVRLDESFGALETSLAEKDVLLKEVHHRVKNNLQIVSSILSIQAGELEGEDSRAAFSECQNRIQAMALVHEEVYRTGSFVELGMRGYLSRICETLRWGRDRSSCRTSIHVHIDEAAALSMDKAIPCGLVVNELVTNSLKHAFAGRETGVIDVSFDRLDGDWRLAIADDGVGKNPSGAPDAPADESSQGIGEQLVTGLVAQLGGSIRYKTSPGGGTEVVVLFPA